MLARYTIEENSIKQIDSETAPIQVYVNPDDAEKQRLISNYKLDEHTLNSALDPEELSRMEFEPDHLAVILNRPKNYSGHDKLLFKVASMGLFLFKNRLIVVISEDIPLFTGKKFRRVAEVNDVFLKLIYNSIYHYVEHLKIINMITDEIEKKLSESMENKYLLNLFTLEKSLVYYYNAINSNGFVFSKMRNSSEKIGFSIEETEMLDDIIIENGQCLKQAEIYSNILASMMDARSSLVSNNLNQLMKTLNLITIGIMVPTLVVSAFSMNVTIPFQKHHHAFWIIMGFAVISVLVTYRYWRYKKW
ncbi:MAG: magnesium transporter CorA family protein [Elusimicrobiaceae bacterium]|nr:magnesium transporter CorA family protein [Elusimicrobiaceae bacterium]